MVKSFLMKLDKIQPSQLYISSEKLSRIMKNFPSKPLSIKLIPVKKLGGQIVFVDGHTRAFAAFLQKLSKVQVYWEDEQLDWEAYEICVKWCREEGIYAIADLKDRVISHQEYKKLWYERCTKMQNNLKQKRKQTSLRSQTLQRRKTDKAHRP